MKRFLCSIAGIAALVCIPLSPSTTSTARADDATTIPAVQTTTDDSNGASIQLAHRGWGRRGGWYGGWGGGWGGYRGGYGYYRGGWGYPNYYGGYYTPGYYQPYYNGGYYYSSPSYYYW